MTTEKLNEAKSLEYEIKRIEAILEKLRSERNACHFSLSYSDTTGVYSVGSSERHESLPTKFNAIFIPILGNELEHLKKELENL